MRMDRVSYYLAIAKTVAERSPCVRRKFGAIIVKNDRIVGSGYNGTARGTLNCGIDIPCIKDVANEPTTISYEYCPAVHAEENAIINSAPQDRIGATMYLAPTLGTGDLPCFKCRRKILNAQIDMIYYIDNEGCTRVGFPSEEWVVKENNWMYSQLEKANPRWKEEMVE